MTYEPPVKDTLFLLKELCDLDHLADLPGYEEATPDMIEAILEEAGKFTAGVLAPLNAPGDRQGARWEDGKVYTADGWGDAYSQFVEGGWNGLPFSPELGGMGLPMVLNSAVAEMIHAANMSFALCPMLTQGAVEALQAYASDEIKDTYLPKMVSGEWTGTMNLTEPQAGSDLAAVRSKAVPEGDHYRISGQKIFITYGDH
ncbi:MAG: acyl-CoA dehydrogenase family protein, partial [Rhodospirillaceae bacterium]